jgi:hypothetical protein
MSLSGARGIAAVSRNPGCELQAAMVAEQVIEPDFYRAVTGRVYEREFGMRESQRKRGVTFEANLYANEAGLLRQAVRDIAGVDPADMRVRNLADEVTGARPFVVRSLRYKRTRRILADLAAGRPVPELVVQPQLVLPTGDDLRDYTHIGPDFMVLDALLAMYVPGEIKSFIVRGGVADAGDLDPTRRQAGVEILALRAVAGSLGLEGRITDEAVFVFATPYGLRPYPAIREDLKAEVYEMRKAVRLVAGVRERVAGLRATVETPLAMLVDELQTDYQEGCIGTCVLADECRRRSVGTARILGDVAADVFGADADLGRVLELLAGAPPEDQRERDVLPSLLSAMAILNLSADDLRRLVA